MSYAVRSRTSSPSKPSRSCKTSSIAYAAVTNPFKDALWARTGPPVSSASARKCASL